MKDDELYNELRILRDHLKEIYYNNKRPVICSDSALQELARLAPRRKEDLLKINGLGDEFVNKYGDHFIEVLEKYHNSNVSKKLLNNDVKTILKNLENRLVNISKRNRLLYMGKLNHKYGFDLCVNNDFNNKVLKLLFGKNHQLKLCNISQDQLETEKRYRRMLQLLREITKDYRENGQYDLYIGYPYVIGKTNGDNFNVRAPLVLFPISFERSANDIIIKLEKTKDILFNNNLILLQNKLLSKNEELPNNVLEDFSENDFYDRIHSFYSNSDIILNCDQDIFSLSNFKDMKVDEFPKFNNGQFIVVPNAVLGKFSLYSNALQKDFKNIIDDKNINELLNELLSNIESVDFYSDEINTNKKEKEEKNIIFSEKSLNYINDLNSSQEQAILSINKNDKLVIQGPPGTGKSQTITSLISDSVNKGRNVLMVSQKKAALDVIYSRLASLSRYALLLSDVKDKETFYNQLYALFNTINMKSYDNTEFNNTSNNIDNQIKTLESIADRLYNTKTNGVETYKLYQFKEENPFNTKLRFDDIFYNLVPVELFNIDYLKLIDLKDKFSNKVAFDTIYNYYQVISKIPFIVDVYSNLNKYDLKKMENDFSSFINTQTNYLKKNIIIKLFTKYKQKREINKLYNQYFYNKISINYVYNKPLILNDILSSYLEFQKSKIFFDKLDENEKLYSKTIFNILEEIKNKNINIDVNNYLFNFIVYCIIDKYEQNNIDLFSKINDFDYFVNSITSLMKRKKDITIQKLEFALVNAFYTQIYFSKRYYEILRHIESKKKWSVSKFLKTYGFELLNGIKIWLMTPESVSEILPLDIGLFDLVIFDEASQIYIEKGIPSIYRAKKIVIAGDHKQLRPSSLGFGRFEYDEEQNIEDEIDETLPNAALEEESLLDLARFKYPSVLLNCHYRAKYEELINFSNYAFYHGKLNVSPNIEEPSTPPIEVIKIENGMWIDRANRNEALKVVETIKTFFKNRKNNESLGVITFNSNQRDMIMDELEMECQNDLQFSYECKKEFARKENGVDLGLFIKNIENVQGDERDCIIFSLGYAKNKSGRVVRNFGWLNQKGGENRLNVAISRAKEKIFIVTSIRPEELFVDDLKNEGPKILRKYLDYCYAVSNKDKEIAKQILYSFAGENKSLNNFITFDSDFENQVYDALVSKGLVVDTQIGVGGYKIDLAIKNKNNNNYILGIECDGRLYHSTKTARERDIYRQKYLESRGWKIYRLWSTKWWHNPNGEIENILNLYNSLLK